MFSVAIVGRPNVGKSTLFNRLIRERKAIVDPVPGVTRDRIEGQCEWLARTFKVIDTGGLCSVQTPFQQAIEMQIQFALKEANMIIFLCSNSDGINVDDLYAARLIRKLKKQQPVLFVANKVDTAANAQLDPTPFFVLGFGAPMPISAEHGIGIGDLLDAIIKASGQVSVLQSPPTETAFCIIGKPNVGKSSFLNALINDDRVLVSDVPGTTRDAIDVHLTWHEKHYRIIDTAGIRRKGKIAPGIEKYAFSRTQAAISRSQIIVLMVDGNEPLSEQDEVIGGLAANASLPTVIAVNKWDLVTKDEHTMAKMTKTIRMRFKYLPYAPIIFVSALHRSRLHTLFDVLSIITTQAQKKVSVSLLNDTLTAAQAANQPPIFNGGRLKITYATQAHGQIPTFVLFCNDPKYLHFSYGRYLEKRIREAFGFSYVPLTLYFKSKNARSRNLDTTVALKQAGYETATD